MSLLKTASHASLVSLFLFAFLGCANAQNKPGLLNLKSKADAEGFAVVELFTSQGCSSCPPADQVLRKIDELARQEGLPVYVLSYHVDYWNYLGWDDPYSKPEFTKRQRAYAAQFKSNQIYTPQMVVNGAEEFVGSKSRVAQKQVQLALDKKTRAKLSVKLKQGSGVDKILIKYQYSGPIKNHALNLAIVSDPPVTPVERGENAGRKLSHINVVRSFASYPLEDSESEIEMQIPDNVDIKQAQLIGFVQNIETLDIIGASKAPLLRKK